MKKAVRTVRNKGRRLLSLLLTVAMCISYMPEEAFAGTSERSGDWTDYVQAVTPAEGVYKISTAKQLAWIAKSFNDGDLTLTADDTVRLVADIDLSAHYWIPIGLGDDTSDLFLATIDGNGHTISGMQIGQQNEPYGDSKYVGLFGYLKGSVKDLRMTDCLVYAQKVEDTTVFQVYAGLLAGYFHGGMTVDHCEFSGAVYSKGASSSSNAPTGGIFGAMGKGTVDACRVDVTLGALDANSGCYFGGVAAQTGQASTNFSYIKNCVSVVRISLPEGMDASKTSSDALFPAGKYGNANNCIGIIDHGGACVSLRTANKPTSGTYSGQVTNKRENVCYAETNFKKKDGSSYVSFDEKYSYYADSENISEMTASEMKSSDFLDTLNAAAAVTSGALQWSIDENLKDGFPNLAGAKIGEGNGEQPSLYCTVKFLNKGEVYKTETVESGKTVAEPTAPGAVNEETFLYWYADDPDVSYNFASPVTEDLTLTAKWKGMEHTVRFESNGGSYVYPQSVIKGQPAQMPDTPIKKGYFFGGWYADSGCTVAWNFDTPITAAKTLYAKWNEITDVALSGRITDSNTEAGIRNATVTLTGGQNATTDEFGYYHISGVEPGTYNIEVSAFGYENATKNGYVVGDSSAGYDAALSPKSGASDTSVDIYATVSCVYSGIMLDGVQIRAVGKGSLGTYEAVTSNGGNALFTGLPAGDYTFEINKVGRNGWESYTSSVQSLSGTHQLSCALKPNYKKLKINVIGSFDPKKNKANQPLAKKAVTLTGVDPKNEDNELIHITAYTDAKGTVTVNKLVPVTWKISCSDYAYEEDEVTVYSDSSGKLSEEEVTLNLPFVDSSVIVNFSSPYTDQDLFKKTDDANKQGELTVSLSGIAGTMTEGIFRSAVPDASGKVIFSGLLPGNYNLSAAGKVSRYVSIKAGDGQEIFTDQNDPENFNRFGKKHFDIDFTGNGTASVALGMRADTTLKVNPAPVSFSGTLFKSDMDKNGEIKTVPVGNTKIYIKSSEYYKQSDEPKNGHEVTTDAQGRYAISLVPGLYGVEVDSTYNSYFGGHLIYHEGGTDGLVGTWGWPCAGTWTGTKASAVSWMTSDDSQAFGDIGGMSLSSGSVIADLEMMEKKINYSAGSSGSTVIYDNLSAYNMITGFEKSEEPTVDPASTVWQNIDSYENTYQTINYKPDTRGATLKLTGSKQETVTMTGKTFPYVFSNLEPGTYSMDYTLGSEFSQIQGSVTDGKEVTFYNFPAPGKLPSSFPEDYAEDGNPWPLSTRSSILRIDPKEGVSELKDLWDGDPANGELQFKFSNLEHYKIFGSGGLQQSVWDENYAGKFSEDDDLNWREADGKLGNLTDGIYPNPPVFDEVLGEYLSKLDDDSTQAEIDLAWSNARNDYNNRYQKWEQDKAAAGFPKQGAGFECIEYGPSWDSSYSNSQRVFETNLVAYSTSLIPDKLFYMKASITNRKKALPGGTLTLYFCAPKGRGYQFLGNLSYIRNREQHEDLYDRDLWFAVTINRTSVTDCQVDFLDPTKCSSAVKVLTEKEINNLLNPRTIVVKAVDEDNPEVELSGVDVTMTYGGKQFSSGTSYAQQTCSGEVTQAEVSGYEWECHNPSGTRTYYDGSTETFYVPLRRISYGYELKVIDDAGNPVGGASLRLTGTDHGQPVYVHSVSDGSASTVGNNELNYQDYTLDVTAPGYATATATVKKEDIQKGTITTVTLNRVVQPTFPEPDTKVTFDRKGAFIPGVNFIGSSNTVEFLTNLGKGKLYLTVEAEVDTAYNDYLKELYLVDARTFKNPDYSDTPEELTLPAMEGNAYNPSEALEWIEKLETGALGHVYYRRFSGGKDIVFTDIADGGGYTYEMKLTTPLWELPPDGFEPVLVAVTDRDAVQIYKVDYSGESEGDQLIGVRMSGDCAAMLENITLMANAKAVGGGAVEKLAELSQPTGSLIPLPSFESGIELSDEGYLDYSYSVKMQLLQGKKSVSDAEKAYMSILPSTLGVAVEGGWEMAVAGEDCEVSHSYNVSVSAQDLEMDDYLPAMFKALPVKVEFDEDNPPTGTFTLAAADTLDSDNKIIKEAYSFGANAQVHINAEVSGFAAFGSVPPVGPVLASLEKSGALDIGAKVTAAVGADGTYTYTIENGKDPVHDVTFTLGAGAGLGIYAKAMGGALGAEANLKLSGDNDKLKDMVTISATVDSEDGFHMNSVEGKVVADAHIEIDTWFINGEKDFTFAEIPFKYQFGTETTFSMTRIEVKNTMRSRNDFTTSTFNGRPEKVVSNLLPIGGFATNEGGDGSFAYTDLTGQGGNVRLRFSKAAGENVWADPATITSTDGLIPAFDVIALSDGKYLAAWSEIAKTDMMKTCPTSVLKYSVGTLSGGNWSGEIKTLQSLSGEVADRLLLISDGADVFLVAEKTAEGALAETKDVAGYKWNGSAFGGATILVEDQPLYNIEAAAAGGEAIVSFVTEDKKLHTVKWGSNVTETTLNAVAFETALASDGENAYLLCEEKSGLALYKYNGGWIKQMQVTEMASPGNPVMTISDGKICMGWTAGNETVLYMAVSEGGSVSRPEKVKAITSGHFKDASIFTAAGKVNVLAVASETVSSEMIESLNAYGTGFKNSPTVTPPEAKTNLLENGSEQELVTAGSAIGGTMLYAVADNPYMEPVDTDKQTVYSTSVPKTAVPGTYYVWYKVVGDEDHYDTNPASLEVIMVSRQDIESRITITYDANGGSGSMDATKTKKYKATVLSANAFEMEGYNFAGWAESASAAEAQYADGSTVRLGADTTLYAIWQKKPVPDISVTFNANGGSGAMNIQIMKKDMATALSTNAFMRDGYTFLGWADSTSATAAMYADKAQVSFGRDITLYAVWQKNPDPTPAVVYVKVTYNPGGGSGSMAVQSMEKGKAASLAANTFTRDGYEFLGWAESASASTAKYADKASAAFTADITLYAVWKKKETGGGQQSGGQQSGSGQEQLPAAGETVKDDKTGASVVIKPAESTQGGQTGQSVEAAYSAPADEKATSVVIPATVTVAGQQIPVTSIEDNAFKGNQNIETVNIGSNVETIGKSAFENCTSLTSVQIPGSVTEIESKAFAGCSAMKSAKVGDGVEVIGEKAFSGCSSMTSVDTGKNTTVIGVSAFEKCSKLKKAKIGNKVVEIRAKAFANCKALTNLTIPKNVKKIGNQIASGDKKMKKITIKSTKLTQKTVGKKAFKGINSKATIKVPASKKKSYKAFFYKCGLPKSVKIK